MRGLVKNQIVFYHNGTPDAIKQRVPLIHDSVNFQSFPGIYGKISGDNYYYQRNSYDKKRVDSMGLNNFLYGSLKFFFTKTPQLPIVKEKQNESKQVNNQRTQFHLLPYLHINGGADLSNGKYQSVEGGFFEKMWKQKRIRASMGVGLSIQGSCYAFNIHYTPLVLNPHQETEKRQQFGFNLGIDY